MSMTYEQASKLVTMLKDASPVDTGQLKGSIQPVFIGPNQIIVIIGNSTANTRKIPSNVYAHITNNYKNLFYHVGGKDSFLMKQVPNRNYHWVNRAIEKWAEEQAFNLVWNTEEDEE